MDKETKRAAVIMLPILLVLLLLVIFLSYRYSVQREKVESALQEEHEYDYEINSGTAD